MICGFSKSISLVLLMLTAAGMRASGQGRCCIPAEQSLIRIALPDSGMMDANAGEQASVDSIRAKSNGKAAVLTLSSLRGKPDAEVVRELAGV